jgi:hypothetical protein
LQRNQALLLVLLLLLLSPRLSNKYPAAAYHPATESTRGIKKDNTGACDAASRINPPTPTTANTLVIGSFGKPFSPIVHPAPLLASFVVSTTFSAVGMI